MSIGLGNPQLHENEACGACLKVAYMSPEGGRAPLQCHKIPKAPDLQKPQVLNVNLIFQNVILEAAQSVQLYLRQNRFSIVSPNSKTLNPFLKRKPVPNRYISSIASGLCLKPEA